MHITHSPLISKLETHQWLLCAGFFLCVCIDDFDKILMYLIMSCKYVSTWSKVWGVLKHFLVMKTLPPSVRTNYIHVICKIFSLTKWLPAVLCTKEIRLFSHFVCQIQNHDRASFNLFAYILGFPNYDKRPIGYIAHLSNYRHNKINLMKS